jgi:caffeoyl-CoA O-methyltransferase
LATALADRRDIVDAEVEAYAEAHTTPVRSELDDLAAETRAVMEAHGMMVGLHEGRFLEMLVAVTGARRVLEIGMFTGYSSLSMAPALPPGGKIITCDVDPKAEAIARRHIESSPFADRIEIRMGPALDTISTLEGPFDFVFIDADKTNYRNYYEAVLPLLSAHGLIAVDNVFWSGRILDPDDDADTRAIAEFNDFVVGDERVVCVMVPIRDGVTLIRKR